MNTWDVSEAIREGLRIVASEVEIISVTTKRTRDGDQEIFNIEIRTRKSVQSIKGAKMTRDEPGQFLTDLMTPSKTGE